MGKQYFVYILTNKNHTVLYTGVTSDLSRRVWEHRNKVVKGFTSRYNVGKLVYFEVGGGPRGAIIREKLIKAGSRKRKVALIESMNPTWEDLTQKYHL